MKKQIALIAAAAMSTAAYADHHETQQHDEAQQENDVDFESMPDTEETSTYDGPDSYTEGQPPPAEDHGTTRPLAGLLADYRPQVRSDYPVCSRDIRDNCVQRRDPGY